MEFGILGPLEVRDGATPVRLGGRRQRALLARLLLDANRTVAVDRLVDDLWGHDVPDSGVKMIHIYVSKLRKLLPPGMLVTRPPGYAIELAPEAIDVVRFTRLHGEGRAAMAAGDAPTAAVRLRDALALWRGAALAEFPEPFAQAEGGHLEELHLACLEDRIDADLALARHADLVGELEALATRLPLRERVRGQLMLALHRSGRHAESLDAYRRFRRALN
jgi:DNA-binding SARP family transcriptional activator